LRKIAVTGGLASGKTTVCRFLEELGAYVLSADAIVHELLSPQSPIGKNIVNLLGEEIVEGAKFNRKVIAEKVFKNKDTLLALEAILHPAVLEEIEKQFNRVQRQKKHTLFVAEIPLLYEIDKSHLFDTVIAVVSDSILAKKRFKNEEEFEKRMNRQLSQEEKSAKADHTLHNDGNLQKLKKQVQELYQQITQE